MSFLSGYVQLHDPITASQASRHSGHRSDDEHHDLKTSPKTQGEVDHGESNEMAVSKNNGTAKSCILIGFSIINHPFWGTSIFGNTQISPCAS